ncbi:MAG: flagellar motor switch protein FliG [Alphaproteobacteria bacterium CG11_big_fil_rev_8_21_14_0_20_44_7]|nr:MAG: flagellar motor switch protein FliG [Alphaproteobacteria bacterium CG11_big_fil_rev_8_21_14_0_20_44_7]
MAQVVEYRKLAGLDKAAIMLMTMSEDNAQKVMELMDEDEIRDLSYTMSNLGQVAPDTIERLFVEFAENLTGGSTVSGSLQNTEHLLSKVLGSDKVSAIMEDIRGPAGRTTWDKLGNVSEEVLANYLKNEYPQTIALVLSKIKPDHAAKVIALFPEDLSQETIIRMLTMDAVKKEVLERVEQTLRSEFMSNLAKTHRQDSHEMMAEIFNNFDRNMESKFLTYLEENNPESAERIRNLMFTFDDLVKIDPVGIQALLRGVDKDKLTVALKGASDRIKNLFFDNMSERALKILKEDMENMGPVRLRDVDEAQMYIVNIAKDLAAKGEIVISEDDGEDQLVY